MHSITLAFGALVFSAGYHLRDPKTYMIAGAVGLGAGVASKDAYLGVGAGASAALGAIGYTAISVMNSANQKLNNVE